jgi:hypothetical protein
VVNTFLEFSNKYQISNTREICEFSLVLIAANSTKETALKQCKEVVPQTPKLFTETKNKGTAPLLQLPPYVCPLGRSASGVYIVPSYVKEIY